MKQDTRDSLMLLSMASTMGISMVLATVIGLGFGYWLDSIIEPKFPWFTMIFLILGIIAGFRNIYIIGKRTQEMTEKQEKERKARYKTEK